MLKITVIDGDTEQTLILEGRLAWPDTSELEAAWQNALRARSLQNTVFTGNGGNDGCNGNPPSDNAGSGNRKPIRPCVIDLRNATYIDQTAEKILLDMKRSGARFIACGVCTRHRLEQLGITCA